MWRADTETINNGVLIRLQNATGPISFGSYLDALSADQRFVHWYSETLTDCGLDSFFWEHPPLTRHLLDSAAEFAILDAPALRGIRADRQAFRQAFDAAGSAAIAVFDNLRGDARLVAPCPGSLDHECTHLAAFLRGSPAELIVEFWREVAHTVGARLAEKPLWLSTSGLGVSWLHVRIDSVPKYYQYRPYTELPGGVL